MGEYASIKKVYARALDPIHIGAGGYRLGRVDNTIVRDPATDVPKIPGTSIAGIVREFYTLHEMEGENCKDKPNDREKRKYGENEAKKIFGDENRKGIFRFYDGEIILFPVSSIQGTVWIATKELLEHWFGEVKDEGGEKIKVPEKIEDEAYAVKCIDNSNPLNLGWLLLEIKDIANGKEIYLPPVISNWIRRIVVVSDKLFSHIINDNLEIRTSVRIDPKTGTAESGKLFTYEAIPRGTVMGFMVGKDNEDNKVKIAKMINSISSYFKLLGIGGMGTRGFGRMEIAVENNNRQNQANRGGGEDVQS